MTKLIDLMYNYSGYRISPPLDLYITDSNISWLATVPEGTTLTIEVSVDEGETWLTCTNNESIPGVQSGVQKLLIKQTLTTNDLDISPQLHSLTIQIGSVGWALEADEWRQDSLIILVDELSDRYIFPMPVEDIDPIIVHLVEEKFIQVSTSGADPPIISLEESSNLVVHISSQDSLAIGSIEETYLEADTLSSELLSISTTESGYYGYPFYSEDQLRISLREDSLLVSNPILNDLLIVGLDEQVELVVEIESSDTLTVGLIEHSGLAISSNDYLEIGLLEKQSQASSCVTIDTLSLSVTETEETEGQIPGGDFLVSGLSEAGSVTSVLDDTDNLDLSDEEDSRLEVFINSSDLLSSFLVEAKELNVNIDGSDQLELKLEERVLEREIRLLDFLAVSLLDPVLVLDIYLTSFDSLSIKAKELILLLPENQVKELGSVFVNNIDLSFLGVTVTRETVVDIVPNKKDRRVSIPGKHGEIVIPGKLSSRMIQLALHIEAEDTNLLGMIKEELFKLFDPSNGWLELRFTLRPDRVYYCRYSGQTSLQEWIIDQDITIPLKMFDPYIYNYRIKDLVGNGTIQNEGQATTPLIIEITGPATSPAVNIGDSLLTYSKNLAGGEKLIIDGKTMKVTKGIENALPDLSGGLEALLIPPGATSVSCSSGTAKFKWQERWEI